MRKPIYDIPADRKLLYYGGMALSACGFLLFLSNFCIAGSAFKSEPTDFDTAFNNHRDSMSGMMARGIGGMVMMIAGGMLMKVGAYGWAGAGVVLDPQRARQEREPLNRAAGGMLNDAIEEIDVFNRPAEQPPPLPEVKLRCRNCSALSDETSKFCGQCGKPL